MRHTPAVPPAVRPDLACCLQRGGLLFADDHETGLALFERAHAIDPTHQGARTCLTLGHIAAGTHHVERENWAGALAAYRRALAIDPHHAGAHFNLGWELLRQGQFEEGWREYEWRWRWKKFGHPPRAFGQPQWRGEPLDGARILLHAEQGYGDTIQFVRYAPLVARRGGVVIVEADRSLARLLATVPCVAQVVAKGESLPAFDWHCPMMSLPLAFGTTLDTIPAEVPYVHLEAGSSGPANAADSRTRVGIVWASGSPDDARYQRRSIPFELLAPLRQIDAVQWYSLQKGPAAAAVAASPAAWPIIDLSPSIHDFADTARFIAGLDLVISVDTSVAHLAGAMGKPVWILVSRPCDWRWLVGRTDSPWYPSARLFVQPAPGQWAPVIAQLAAALPGLR